MMFRILVVVVSVEDTLVDMKVSKRCNVSEVKASKTFVGKNERLMTIAKTCVATFFDALRAGITF